MQRQLRFLTGTTAIALGLTFPGASNAQQFPELNGVMVPSCSADGSPVDAGTLTVNAFTNGGVTAEGILAATVSGEACVSADGTLQLGGNSAAATGAEAAATEPFAEAPAAEDEPAAPTEPVAEAAAPTVPFATAPGLTEPVAEAPAPAEPVAVAPATADPFPTALAPTEPAAEAPAPTEPVAEAPAPLEPFVEVPAPTAPVAEAPVQPAPEPDQPAPAFAAAAAADDNGRGDDAAQVTETMVTEENSRSSAEEFAKPDQDVAAAPSAKPKKGLSNFEKFALGAAGIVALDAIIGRNREVVSNSGDRVVLRDESGRLEVLRDDDTLLRRPGSEVRTETFSDGSTRTTITRADGSRIVTIADASGRVLKRSRFNADGTEILLIDDTAEVRPVDVTRLPALPARRSFVDSNDRRALEAALRTSANARIDRRFTLRQVRQYREVRDLMPEISIDAINFASGSAAIQPEEAEELLDLGQALSDFIADNPDEIFLVEGHTDAVGGAASNLALSDRRAESVALALTEYFGVPPENMIIQGYGEAELLVPTDAAERANRRAVVRRVTPLLR